MSLPEKLPNVFENSICSLADYDERIKIIEGFFKSVKKRERKWGIFYRGDKESEKTQSKLFREKNLDNEAAFFDDWKRRYPQICEEQKNEFMQLAYMQHHEEHTRLLDFTTKARVALRFACGYNGDIGDRKVTIYITDYLTLTPNSPRYKEEILNRYLRLIKDDKLNQEDREQLKKDIFVKVHRDFPRIKRQHGLFLLMGNLTTDELINGKEPDNHSKKVEHELSPIIGRGRGYNGYVGVLTIAADYVDGIRSELENNRYYNMNYLMANEQEV